MRNVAESLPSDPEFDRTIANIPAPSKWTVRYYQRLVINPFLAVVILLCGFGIVLSLKNRLPKSSSPWWGLSLFVMSYFCVQFHCLDCGASGMFARRNRHACRGVRERWLARRMVPTYYPGPVLQLKIWGLTILGVVMLALTVWRR